MNDQFFRYLIAYFVLVYTAFTVTPRPVAGSTRQILHIACPQPGVTYSAVDQQQHTTAIFVRTFFLELIPRIGGW